MAVKPINIPTPDPSVSILEITLTKGDESNPIDRLLYKDADLQIAGHLEGGVHIEGSLDGIDYDVLLLATANGIMRLPFVRFIKFIADNDITAPVRLTLILRK